MKSAVALPAGSTVIERLAELQTQRRFCIVSQSRCDRSIDSLIARAMGYKGDLPEKERKALFRKAKAARLAVEKGGDGQGPSAHQTTGAVAALSELILLSKTSREGWDNHRSRVEAQMRALVRSLPAYAFASTVKGFGDLGLAIIAGETGDLANYATKERVWKRLGLAVIAGERQQKKLNKDEAAAHGYSPRRRAEVWSLCSDSMFRHQWKGVASEYRAAFLADKRVTKYCAAEGIDIAKLKTEADCLPLAERFGIECEGQPAGPYGVVYAKRRAVTASREGWSKLHQANDARRVMTKALIEDLWRVWRGMPPLHVAD